MDGHAASERAAVLAARLEEAASALTDAIAAVGRAQWRHVSAPGVWSIGKDVEHVIEATGYHEWIIRLTIGDSVSSRRPILERERLTTDLSPDQAVEQVRRRSAEVADLVVNLTDDQLTLPTRPPRARSQVLAETIERVLIGHFDTHREQIRAKADGLDSPATMSPNATERGRF